MESKITRIKRLPPDYLEIKIGQLISWLVNTPKTKIERQNKYMGIILLLITILSVTGLLISVFGR